MDSIYCQYNAKLNVKFVSIKFDKPTIHIIVCKVESLKISSPEL